MSSRHAGLTNLKMPTEVRALIRRLPPELKRKLRAALADILDNPAWGKALKEELEGLWSLRVGRSRITIGLAGATLRSLLSVRGKTSMKTRLDNLAETGRSHERAYLWKTLDGKRSNQSEQLPKSSFTHLSSFPASRITHHHPFLLALRYRPFPQ